jgi:conjugative transfer signal peptidase TraF
MTLTGLFNNFRATSASQMRKVAVTAATAFTGAFLFCGWLGVRFNTSPSLPLGLYVTTTDRSASLVEFCPAEPFATFAIARGYRDPGACPDGAPPLLKPIVASAGDTVELSAVGISVNGVPLRNTAPLARDSAGRPLSAWPFGPTSWLATQCGSLPRTNPAVSIAATLARYRRASFVTD